MKIFKIITSLFALLLGSGYPTLGYHVNRTMSVEVYTESIPVFYWVRDTVSISDKIKTIADIQSALNQWAGVSRSVLKFHTKNIVVSSAMPAWIQGDLYIKIGNRADFSFGGSAGPHSGNPGIWHAAVADRAGSLTSVAVHEIGHALGFYHSTIGYHFPKEQRPLMHWSAGTAPSLTVDDRAAAIDAYPLLPRTGVTIVGNVVSKHSGKGVSGVNLVTIDGANPLVAKLSGSTGTGLGQFTMHGVPYMPTGIKIMDGRSWRGCCVGVADCCWVLPPIEYAGLQIHNFDDIKIDLSDPMLIGVRGAFTFVNLGNIELDIFSMFIDAIDENDSFGNPTPFSILPVGVVGEFYDWWLRIAGGHRGLQGTVISEPPGISITVEGSPKGTNSHNTRGSQWIRFSGIPTNAGLYTVKVSIVDRDEITKLFNFNFNVSEQFTGIIENDLR